MTVQSSNETKQSAELISDISYDTSDRKKNETDWIIKGCNLQEMTSGIF